MPTTNLEKLNSQRIGTKRIIERFIDKLAEAREEDDMVEYEATIEAIQNKACILQSLNEKILTQTDAEAIEDEMLNSEEYSLDLEVKLRKFKRYLVQRSSHDNHETQSQRLDTQTVNTQQRNDYSSNNSGQPNPFPGVSTSNISQFSRLPKLTLPKFDGDLLQWQSFWDSFDSSIHSNINLGDVQKFGYLKAQLEGTAAMTVDGFALTNANYMRAVELLRERYGQQSKIVHATMQALLNLPEPTSTVHSLRSFYDRMETYIRGLESLGQNQDMYGSLLVPIVIDKLPTDIRRNLARANENNDWILQDLRRAINKEINILETGSSNPRPEVAHNPTALFYTGTRGKRASNSSNANKSENRSNFTKIDKHTPKCAFCQNNHHSYQCKTFPDMGSRLTVVKQKQLCFNCLGNHQLIHCKSRKTCRYCDKRHHSSICSKNTQFQSASQGRPEAAILYTDAGDTRPDVLLKTAVAEVGYNQYTTSANILLDEGAQRSFISEKLAKDLHLPRIGTDVIHVASFGKQSHDVRHLDKAEVFLKTDSGEKIKMNVLIIPTIAVPIQNRIQKQAATLPYLQILKLAHPVTSDDMFEISFLIGADYYWKVVQDRVIRGNGPTAVNSKIGYLLSGPVTTPVNQSSSTVRENYVMNVMTTAPPRADDIDRFWKLESLGISADENEETDVRVMRDYQQTHISFHDGKYEARLPWKQDHEPLPTNYDITKRRTESTKRRLSKDTQILNTYSNIIADQEKRDFIEKVPEEDLQRNNQQIHYIPHHPVKKDSDTTPVRIVYDCSCRQSPKLPSLNDCLQSTPPALNDLTSILVRFRLHEFAVSTDIEKAFLHVGLQECDRDVTRFLWLSDPSDVYSPLQTYRFKAVLFGATCSPFILDATLQKHLQENSDNWTSQKMKKDLYVDNIISSFSHEDTVLQYFRDARDLMSSAGFNLRAWTSNSDQLKALAESEKVNDPKQITKVLGMTWNTAADDIGFTTSPITVTSQNATKREILRQTSRIYDPLGLLTPVTVRAKILVQDIWRQNFDWDTILPGQIQDIWNTLVMDLNQAMQICVDRYYFRNFTSSANVRPTLHIFVDASMKSYGAAAYIVKGRQSTLVMAKNRVAPLKSITLPKLELMAAVIGSRLASHLQTTLNCSNVFLWSDSQIVLHWLKADKSKPLQRFVKNRINEIHELTGSYKWSYCPTLQNPADLLTRGISAKQHKENKLWWNGPKWITDDQQWPRWSSKPDEHTHALLAATEDQHILFEAVNSITENDTGLHKIIDTEKYSNYKKLLRVTAYVLRFVNSCRKPEVRLQRNQGLRVDEIHSAERLWLQNCQQISYADEFNSLRSGTSRRHSLVKQLRLFLDADDFLRCGGRIHNAPLSDMTKFPILLPAKHHLTRLIVLNAHHEIHHSGASATITLLRQRYWVPTIRQCVKTVIRRCVTCRKVQGKPFSAPDPPPLMKYRVQDSPPFSVTGVDYTGALHVKNATGSETKCYICLFTCASTRAVHLEVVSDLTADAFIQAFRRFVSRKSLPYLMVSDNGTTFISAATHLQQLSETVHDELITRGTRWDFIPKRAPWFGGFWERLIGLTKTTLKKILGRAFITYGMLQTIVTEIEATLNDRPLTYVGSEFELEEAITPAHLLYGRRVTTLPYRDITSSNLEMTAITGSDIRKRAKVQQTLVDHFRDRWRKEYLTALREHHTVSGKNEQIISVGSVVQVHDETPRSSWKLAVVEEVVRGNDGLVRSAKIRINGNKLTNRPITKLYPLEVNSSN